MSQYDPTEDPRHLPGDEMLEAQKRLDAEEEAVRLTEQMEQFEQLLDMMSHAGWDIYTRNLELQRSELESYLTKEKEPLTWKFYRGQLVEVEWLLGLADEADRKVKVIRARRNELWQQMEGAQE